MTDLKPLDIIVPLCSTDPYIQTIFSEGGCYRFHLFLQTLWPEATPVMCIESNHVATLIDGIAYDIDGVVAWPYKPMTQEDIAVAEKWCFADNAFLCIGECPVCEEPILVSPKMSEG